MSAELLRRAAKLLREHAEAASPGDWMAATHTGRKDGISLIGRVEDRGTGAAIAVFAGSDVHQRAADAEYATLMHPPVALALAESLDSTAETFDGVPSKDLAAEMFAPEIDLARAILREES